MSDENVLKKVALMLLTNNKQLLLSIQKELQLSEERIKQDFKQELTAAKQQLSEEINASQEDTIEVLSALIHTGYDLHEKRIERLENSI